MCTTCGCATGEVKIDAASADHQHEHVHADGTRHSHPHDHAAGDGHEHPHAHAGRHSYAPVYAHSPGLGSTRMVRIEQDLLAKNDAYAARNRQRLADRGIFALNLVSSPGSGKTTLLIKTIERLGGKPPVAVIEGDQQTSQDAERIRATGVPAIQINTGKGCHLDAHMVGEAMDRLELPDDSLLMIENVGNLVCPAAFDLGEAHKVVIFSVTEGEDKPIKYPDMFRAASLLLMNKCDLLPHLSFSVPRAIDYARRVNPGIEVIELSATTGEGIAPWLDWIERGAGELRARRRDTIDKLKRRVAELEGQLAARGA